MDLHRVHKLVPKLYSEQNWDTWFKALEFALRGVDLEFYAIFVGKSTRPASPQYYPTDDDTICDSLVEARQVNPQTIP
jgi:hypothetical protein